MDQKPSRRRWLFGMFGGWFGTWLASHVPNQPPSAPQPAPLLPSVSASWTDTSNTACTCVYDGRTFRVTWPTGHLAPPDSSGSGQSPPTA